MDRREMLAACAGLAAGGGHIDAIDVKLGDEPLCFVLTIPERISPDARSHLLEDWDHIRASHPALRVPLLVVDGGATLRLVKKSDAETPDG